MQVIKTVDTDVLIIGGGGAGLCAAIAARKEGAKVMLVSKGRPGRANNTAISGGTFAAATGLWDERDTPELHLQDTLVAGRWINQPAMVRKMVFGALEQVQNFLSYGAPLQKKEGEKLWILAVPGHSVARNVFTKRSFGTDFTLPLVRHAQNVGVDFLAGGFVERLCQSEEGDMAGALIIDPARQGLVLIRAKATVLAAGGAGQVYSQTNNAPGTTGDGYALAFRLGVPLMDMEFVQYYPTYLFEPALPKTMTSYEVLVFRGGARLFNRLEEDIARRYGLNDPAAMTRDALTLAIAREIKEGRGVNGGVWMDFSTIPEQKIERYQKFIPRGLKGRKRFLVFPLVHHFMGGLLVNERGETGVEGLYSAGEVNGGVHGANRLGGNALTEAWVYGDLTGRLAAQTARRKEKTPRIENLQVMIEEIKGCAEGKKELSGKEIRQELQRLMWEKAGVIRNKESLSRLIDELEKLKENLNSCRVNDGKELVKKLETGNMLLVGEAVARSALFREESRGAHYREDFPDEGGERWMKNILIKRNNDGGNTVLILDRKD